MLGYTAGSILRGHEFHYTTILDEPDAPLADVFDALSSKRVYKDAWKEEDVLVLIKKESGAHFDPELVEIFFEALDVIRSIQDRYKN